MIVNYHFNYNNGDKCNNCPIIIVVIKGVMIINNNDYKNNK